MQTHLMYQTYPLAMSVHKHLTCNGQCQCPQPAGYLQPPKSVLPGYTARQICQRINVSPTPKSNSAINQCPWKLMYKYTSFPTSWQKNFCQASSPAPRGLQWDQAWAACCGNVADNTLHISSFPSLLHFIIPHPVLPTIKPYISQYPSEPRLRVCF